MQTTPNGPFRTFEDLEVYQVAGEFDDLNVCLDERYLPEPEVDQRKQLGWRVHSIINGYGRYLRRRKSGETPGTLREDSASYVVSVDADGDESDPFADVPL